MKILRRPFRSGIISFDDGTIIVFEEYEGITQTTCGSFSFETFPVDTVNCSIDIGAKNLKIEVDLVFGNFMVEETALKSNRFIDQSEVWRFNGLSNSSIVNFRSGQVNAGYATKMLSFEIHFSRKSSLHYLATILIPIVCLNLIQSFAFCLPPESERSTFAMTTVLAYYVVLGTSYNYIPQTSETVILVVYAIIKLVWSTAIVIYMLVSALFANYYTEKKAQLEKMAVIRKIDIIATICTWLFSLLVDFSLYLAVFR